MGFIGCQINRFIEQILLVLKSFLMTNTDSNR